MTGSAQDRVDGLILLVFLVPAERYRNYRTILNIITYENYTLCAAADLIIAFLIIFSNQASNGITAITFALTYLTFYLLPEKNPAFLCQ